MPPGVAAVATAKTGPQSLNDDNRSNHAGCPGDDRTKIRALPPPASPGTRSAFPERRPIIRQRESTFGPQSRRSREFGNFDVLAAPRPHHSTGGPLNCKGQVLVVVAGLCEASSSRHSWVTIDDLPGSQALDAGLLALADSLDCQSDCFAAADAQAGDAAPTTGALERGQERHQDTSSAAADRDARARRPRRRMLIFCAGISSSRSANMATTANASLISKRST